MCRAFKQLISECQQLRYSRVRQGVLHKPAALLASYQPALAEAAQVV